MLIYEIENLDPDTHEFEVRLTSRRDSPGAFTLSLPAWIPGSYMIRDFARHVIEISANDATGSVTITKMDKQTWRVASDHPEVTVRYRVYAFDLSVRAAYLDRQRAYFNGTCLFLRPDDVENWELRIRRPPGANFSGWRVATSLPADAVDVDGFGRYSGHGIDILDDCPVEIGDFAELSFEVDGVPHRMTVSQGGSFDKQRIAHDLAPICSEHAAMFGELPIQRYLFQTLATADGYGGLEHADSTSLICKRADLPRVGLERPDKGYRQFLGLCSHEYFHLWNVKRIRPAAFAAGGLAAEVHTELLWAFEGITSYYDELALVRSGVLEPNEYLDLFATTVTRVMRGAGRHRQSIAESSFDAWTKFYKQDENAPNAIVSYYAKGALVAFGLDVTLRRLSADTLSLDDLMRALWQRHGRTGEGVPERAIEVIADEIVGESLEGFFADYVYGTVELPLADWFAAVGIGYRLRPARAADDLGGNSADAASVDGKPVLGARGESSAEGLNLTHVFAGGAAQAAGLAAGDLLIAIDGERLGNGDPGALLQRAEGPTSVAHYFRRGRLMSTELTVQAAADDTCDLWQLPSADVGADVQARRAAWWRSNRRQGR